MKNSAMIALAVAVAVLIAPLSASGQFSRDCFYCAQDARLDARAILITELKYSRVYLLKNQFYPGRCIVVFKSHKTELYQLTKDERDGYMGEVASVAKAISNVFHPDKINYAVFGDEVSHLHFHIVPKKRGTLGWGEAFPNAEDTHPTLLTEAQYHERLTTIKDQITLSHR